MARSLIPRFRADAAAALRFFRTVPWPDLTQKPVAGKPVGIFVCAWQQTAVPWFNIATALLLRSAGLQPVVIFDDLPFEATAEEEEQIAIIARVLSRLPEPVLPVLRLGALAPASPDGQEMARIEVLAKANLIRSRMTSVGSEGDQAARMVFRDRLAANYARIKPVGEARDWAFLLAPGGLYANSGLYLLAGKTRGVRVATYDAGYGRIFIGCDDVACYFYDDLRAFEVLVGRHGLDSPQSAILIEESSREFQLRLAGTDDQKFQTVPLGRSRPIGDFDVVIPMSIDWDAPGLCRNRFFPSPAAWVRETVEYLLTRTSARVAFRQHPYIRHVDWWDKQDGYREMLADLAASYPDRFQFFDATDQVNTYELIQHGKVVLPYVSAIGIEAVFLGKPVIVESSAHYSRLPFVHSPASREEYFRLIEAGIAGKLPAPGADAIAQAYLYFHIFQSAHYLFTDFTPQPQDYARWSGKTFGDLNADRKVGTLVGCLADNRPISLVNVGESLSVQPTAGVEPMPSPDENLGGDIGAQSLERRYPQVSFGLGVQIIGLANTMIGAGSCVADGCWLNVCQRDAELRLKIGRCVLIGRQSMLSAGSGLEIGDYCLFAPRVYVSSADHVFEDIGQPVIQQGATLDRTVVVEENCWLGINAVVSGNLTVGRGSVIAANTVVNRDIPPFSVVAGSPGKIVKMYDPRVRAWVRTRDDGDVRRVLAHRRLVGLPTRQEYAALLASNARVDRIDPIVAGRGVSI